MAGQALPPARKAAGLRSELAAFHRCGSYSLSVLLGSRRQQGLQVALSAEVILIHS